MVILSGQNNGVIPNHSRQNRRRERPGSRTRRSINRRKSRLQSTILEDLDEAYYMDNIEYPERPDHETVQQIWMPNQKIALATIEELEQVELERIFGGDSWDDVSLCEPMLRVLSYLFGDTDYTDP